MVNLLEGEPGIHLSRFARPDWDRIEEYISASRPQIVIHAAACGLRHPRPTYYEMAAFNVGATLRLFEATPDAHFIFIGTGLAYVPKGRPLTEDDPLGSLDAYASTKAAADLLLRAAASASGRRLTVVRPFSFSGVHDGGGRLFPSLLSAAARGVAFAMSPGRQVRDYCAVDDVAAAIHAVVHRRPESAIEVFNVGSGHAVTLRELVEHVCQALGLKVEIHFGARPYAPHDPMHLVADITLARHALSWAPAIDFVSAIRQLARSAFPELKLPHRARSRAHTA